MVKTRPGLHSSYVEFVGDEGEEGRDEGRLSGTEDSEVSLTPVSSELELLKEKVKAGSKAAAVRLVAGCRDLARRAVGEAGGVEDVLRIAIETIPPLLHSKLSQHGQASSHWSKYSHLLRRFVSTISKSLSQLSSLLIPPLLPYLKPIYPLIPLLDPIYHRQLCRAISAHWGKSDEKSVIKHSENALKSLISLPSIDPAPAIRRIFLTFLGKTNPSSLLRKSCVRLLDLSPAAYKSLFSTHISVMFSFLSDVMEKRNETGSIASWEFVNATGVFVGAAGRGKKGGESGEWERTVGLALGAAGATSGELRFAPFRLALMCHLVSSESLKSTHIPGVSSQLLSILTAPELHKRSKPASSSTFSLYSNLTLGKEVVWDVCRTAIVTEACRLLLTHLSIFDHTVIFPEFSGPIAYVLDKQSKSLKVTPNQSNSITSVLKSTLKTVEDGRKWMVSQRVRGDFTGSGKGEGPLERWRDGGKSGNKGKK